MMGNGMMGSNAMTGTMPVMNGMMCTMVYYMGSSMMGGMTGGNTMTNTAPMTGTLPGRRMPTPTPRVY